MQAVYLAICVLAALQAGDYRHTPIDNKPTVALLPIVNVSGEKWEELKTRQVERATEHLVREFASRGFSVIPPGSVLESLKRLNIDLKDEEVWRRQTVLDVGRDVGAKYSLFIAITRTEQKQQERLLFTDLEGQTEVRMWLMNCETSEPILSARTFVGRSGGARIGDGKGSSRQIQSAVNAVSIGLREFFKGYPVLR